MLKEQQQQSFYSPLSGTTRVSQYQKKHSPTHRPDHHPVLILYQLLPSTTIHSILPVQITCLAIFLHNLFPHPLWSTSWSGPSTSYSIHFFTRSVSSFRSTCPYHRNLLCCSIKITHLFLVFLSTPYLELCLLP